MARIKLEVPSTVHFTTEIPVRITDINYGGHVGNDAFLSLIHEVRIRFLAQYGYTELNIEGVGIIMSDAALVYKSEAFHGDILYFGVSVVDFHRFGCDIFYRISNSQTGKEIARAKTGIIFFNYETKKMVDVPPGFRSRFITPADIVA